MFAGFSFIHVIVVVIVLAVLALIVWGAFRLIAAGTRRGTIQANAASQTQAPTPSGPPAGWYADPQGGADMRWWDGAVWTEHRQPSAS